MERSSVKQSVPVSVNSRVLMNAYQTFMEHMLRGGQVLLNYFVLLLMVLVWFIFFS